MTDTVERVLAACILTLASCLGRFEPEERSTGDVEPETTSGAESSATGTMTSATASQPTSSSPEASGTSTEPWEGGACGCPEPIGVPECDHYFNDYCPCVIANAPESILDQLLDALQQTCGGWSEIASGATADNLPATCRAAFAAVATTSAEWKCEFRPLPDSCAGFCGEAEIPLPVSDQTCSCSANCHLAADCCADFDDLCVASGSNSTGASSTSA